MSTAESETDPGNSPALVSAPGRNQLSEWGREHSFVLPFRAPEEEGVVRVSESLCTHPGSHVNTRQNPTLAQKGKLQLCLSGMQVKYGLPGALISRGRVFQNQDDLRT